MGKSSEAVPSTLRKINIRSTLEILKQRGECSRADLTRLTGVSAPTMSKLLSDLMACAMIEEFSRTPKGKGRPSKSYRLADKAVFILGLVIDIKQCRIVSAGLDGKVDMEQVVYFPTPASYEELVEQICIQLLEFTEKNKGSCLGIGVSVPGLIDKDGVIELSPNIRMLDGKNICADLKRMTGVEVIAMQEEYGMCLAEQHFGATDGCGDFVMVDISSGLGMGAFCGNKYVYGAQGFGCELGHITVKPDGPLCNCGNYGCLETLAGDKAIAAKMSQQLGREVKSLDIVEVATAEQLDVSNELEEALNYLAIGVATAINLFNPEKVFIYGRMFELGENTFERFKRKVEKRALAPVFRNCRIRRASVKKVQGPVAGICSFIFEQAGPRLDTIR